MFVYICVFSGMDVLSIWVHRMLQSVPSLLYCFVLETFFHSCCLSINKTHTYHIINVRVCIFNKRKRRIQATSKRREDLVQYILRQCASISATVSWSMYRIFFKVVITMTWLNRDCVVCFSVRCWCPPQNTFSWSDEVNSK